MHKIQHVYVYARVTNSACINQNLQPFLSITHILAKCRDRNVLFVSKSSNPIIGKAIKYSNQTENFLILFRISEWVSCSKINNVVFLDNILSKVNGWNKDCCSSPWATRLYCLFPQLATVYCVGICEDKEDYKQYKQLWLSSG